MITVWIEPSEFSGDLVRVEGDKYRHLFRARRLRAGTRIRVVDGLGHAREAAIDSVDAKSATLSLQGESPSNEPSCSVALFVGAPKPPRLATLVEKATELGVASIDLVPTTRTARSVSPSELDRLRRIAISAVEQSHRSRLPDITLLSDWDSLVGLLHRFSTVWLLDPSSSSSPQIGSGSERALIVGPEGGLTPQETEVLLEQGVRPVGLGPRILRTETAAIVGLSAIIGSESTR